MSANWEERAETHAEMRFGALLESLPDAVILVDAAGQIVLASEVAEQMFGYSRGELIGQAAERLLSTRFRGAHAFRQSSSELELFGLRKNHSEFPIELVHKSLHTEEAAFGLSAIRDLTGRKRLEQKLKEKDAALEAVQHEFESFSHSIAHDLRAPLRAVNGFSNLLKKSLGENLTEDSALALSRVQDNAAKMGKMIEGLLDLASLSRVAMTKKAINPAEVVKNSFTELTAANNGRKIDFAVGELPACHADALLLRRLFDALLSNAIKFTRKCDPAVIRVGCRQENRGPIYFIQDNGAGFDMEYAGKLFQAFQRLHGASEFEGLGMGLAVAHRIVQRHGGRIWGEGEVDRGATFYFTLGESEYGNSVKRIDC